MMLQSLAMVSVLAAGTWNSVVGAVDAKAESEDVAKWRENRVAELKSDTGWLTLAGLFWLKPGDNTFGRATSNTIVLDNAGLPQKAGVFTLNGSQVRFVASAQAGITHEHQPVTTLDLVDDSKDSPTVLQSGPLSFFVIERSGQFGIRVRDRNSPSRTGFKGLDYFPVQTDWVINARFEPYQPHRKIKIINILGMEDEMDDWGAVVFEKDGQEWRLDAVLEDPGDHDLFVMLRDGTSGKETYGAGRFLRVPFPADGRTTIDFNKAYNPPCAFSDYATCPLPPPQNRLSLKIDAGEKKYAAGHEHTLPIGS